MVQVIQEHVQYLLKVILVNHMYVDQNHVDMMNVRIQKVKPIQELVQEQFT